MSRISLKVSRKVSDGPSYKVNDNLVYRGGNGGPTVTYAVWNSADKNANIALSNGDLTGQYGGGWVAVRANQGVVGKDAFYQLTVDSQPYAGAGVATSDASLTYPGENGSSSWGITSHGYDNFPGGYSSNGVTFANGDVMGVSIIRSTNTAKFYKLVAGSWSLVYTADTSSVAANVPLYPMLFVLGGQGTANFGESAFAAAVPDGCEEGVFQ